MDAFAIWNQGLEAPLARTLKYAAAKVPYYRSKLPSVGAAPMWDVLPTLPLLSKTVAIDNIDALRASTITRPGRVSTGTLRAGRRFLDVQHTEEETRAIARFEASHGDWDAVQSPEAWESEKLSLPDGGLPPEILEVVSLHHQFPSPTREPGVLQLGWHTHPNCVEVIAELLAADRFPTLNVMRIVPGPFAKLTYLLQQRGFDFFKSPIRCVTLYGYVTPRWRALLQATWHAETYEVFSMSELRNFATPCEHNTEDAPHFHFADLPLVTEVLDPVRFTPVSDGTGHLVVTTLYPFVQQQPFVRYVTGDLVQIVPCAHDTRLGFRWQGRTDRYAVWDDVAAHRSILTERDVLETLDEHPMVVRSRDDFELLGRIPEGTMGWPIFEIAHSVGPSGKPTVTVRVSIRHVPSLYPHHSAALELALKMQVLRACPTLARAVDSNEAAFLVELLGPDADEIVARHGINQLFYPTAQPATQALKVGAGSAADRA